MITFLRQFLLFAAVLGLLIYGLHYLYGTAIVHPRTGLLFGFMAALTFLIYSLTARLVAVSPTNLGIGYLIGMTVRMLTSLALVTVHLAQGGAKEGRGTWTFLGAFFVLYFSWAGFEIWAILSNLRPISKKQVAQP
jgi:drug/metabolite transporter (DMT)-like permease